MRYSTPLRYPGGKSKLANFIKLVLIKNKLLDGHYAEPYAGGAGIAFHLLLDSYVKHIHINDLNASVYAFWHSVVQDTENLCRLIRDTPVTIKSWKKQKSIQDDTKNHSTLEIGFSTFFLNRTNRSGIINGGIIGGKEQNSYWTLDARFNKQALISRIEKISNQKENITLYNQDAAQFIVKTIPSLPTKSLIYLDPPYYVKGRGLYQNYYGHNEHVAIAKLVSSKIKRYWIVSYDDAPEIRKMYTGYRKIGYKLSYSTAERYKGSEIMFFCEDLIIPKVDNPAKLNKPNNFATNSQLKI